MGDVSTGWLAVVADPKQIPGGWRLGGQGDQGEAY